MSSASSYNDAQEVQGLLPVLSPPNSKTHTPEGHFTSLETQMLAMDNKNLPGGLRNVGEKGKQFEESNLPQPSKSGTDHGTLWTLCWEYGDQGMEEGTQGDLGLE